MTIPHIFIFSPQAQFLNRFFSTEKRVNRDKINFAAIQRKWQQSRFCNETAQIATKKICLHIYHVEKCLHVTDFTPHFSTWHDFSLYLPCRDISPTEYLSCGGTSPHDNLSYGKFSPHDNFFLHKHRLWCLWQISGMVGLRSVNAAQVSTGTVVLVSTSTSQQ